MPSFKCLGAILLLLVASITNAQLPIERPFPHDNITRWFNEYRPLSYQANTTNSACLFWLHGGRGHMREINSDYVTIFGQKRKNIILQWSDKNGFLLLAPNANNVAGNETRGYNQVWNDGRVEDVQPNVNVSSDDVGFLANLARWAVAERGVNPAKIYLVGGSNGGIMIFRALMETTPPIYAAAAAFVASLPVNAAPPPTDLSTPLFLMNGNKDPVLPWAGGTLVLPEYSGKFGSMISVEATRDYFIQMNQADTGKVQKSTLPNRCWFDRCRILSEFYPANTTAARSAPLVFYTMDGGGHTIPLTELIWWTAAQRRFAGPLCRDVDGLKLIWDFLKSYNLK